jgi:hypothetical protein
LPLEPPPSASSSTRHLPWAMLNATGSGAFCHASCTTWRVIPVYAAVEPERL